MNTRRIYDDLRLQQVATELIPVTWVLSFERPALEVRQDNLFTELVSGVQGDI
jgi:hypothetical protein